MDKSPDAFRTISEVADLLDTPAHVLRFWESRFTQIRPVKRAGGRRYYRPTDVALLAGIRLLLHDQGLTIRGVQKILREQGVRHVCSLVELSDVVADARAEWAGEDAVDLGGVAAAAPAPEARVIAWPGPRGRDEAGAAPDESLDMAGIAVEEAAPSDAVEPPAEVCADVERPADDGPDDAAEPPAGVARDKVPDDLAADDGTPVGLAQAAPSAPETESVAETSQPTPMASKEPAAPPAAAAVAPQGDPLDDMPLFRFAGAVSAPVRESAMAPVAAVPPDEQPDATPPETLAPADHPERPMSARIRALPVGSLDALAVLPVVQGLRDLRRRLDPALSSTPLN